MPSRAMSTSTARVRALETDVLLMRSLLISLVGEDDEGEYRPEFVREMLARASEKPTHTFKNKKQFLKLLAPV